VARRTLIGTGLIVLALWFQALAPLLALRAMTAVDPIAHAVICGRAVQASDPAVPADQAPHTGCTLCTLCQAGLGAAILPDAPPAAALPAGFWQAISWPIPPPAALARLDRHPGQARAPPAYA